MYNSFRQGIIQYSQPDLIVSSSSTTYDLIVEDDPIIITISAGEKNYLWIETSTVESAWTNIVPGVDQWLYWNIDERTGHRTFGRTLLEPVVSLSAPSNPARDQHWYDQNTKSMFVWSGNTWRKKIRVFACLLNDSAVVESLSDQSSLLSGTQVNDNTEIVAGYIVFDKDTNKPITTSTGYFVTTEDELRTLSLADADIKLASTVIAGEAQQNLAAFTIVKFTDFNRIQHADRFAGQQPKRFGIIRKPAIIGQLVDVITDGLVTNPLWDWTSVGINALLYSDDTGILTTIPLVPAQYPVAIVVDRQTIQLGNPVVNNSGVGGDVAPATSTTLGIVRLSVPPANSADPVVIGSNDPILTSPKTPLPHTHPISDIISLSTELNNRVLKAGDTMGGFLTLHADPTALLHAATKQYVDAAVGSSGLTAGGGLTLTGNVLDVGTASTARIVINANNIDLATTGVTPGSYTQVTVDSYGRVLTASNPGNAPITLSGDATGTGTTSIPVTLASTGVTPGSYKITVVDAKGRVVSGSNPNTLAGMGIIDGVTSVNGHTGIVSLTNSDIATSLGYTPVNKAGDAMIGSLILNADPTQPLQAATKQYVDSISGSFVTTSSTVAGVSTEISFTGPVLTPSISLIPTGVTNATYGNATNVPSFVVDTKGRLTSASNILIGIDASQVVSGVFSGTLISEASVTQHQAALTIQESQIADGSLLARIGDNETVAGGWTFVNPVIGANPIIPSHLATKQYVDSTAIDDSDLAHLSLDETITGIWSFVNPVGGVTPVAANDLATKQYVDDAISFDGSVVLANGSVPMTGNLVTPGVNINSTNLLTGSTFNFASVAPVVIGEYNTSTYNTGKFLVSIVSGSDLHAVEILTITDGILVFKSEYGIVVSSAPLGTFDAVINGSNCQLIFTPGSAASMTVKITAINQ